MTIVAFAPKDAPGSWRSCEIDRMVAGVAGEFAPEEAAAWAVGATELGDPQFYLLAPPPDEKCILCVSRLGRLYVLEDGRGRVLFEHADLDLLVQQAKAILKRSGAGLLAQLTLAWGFLRQSFEEKVEPVLAEGEDLLMHMAPQLAALA